MRNVELSRTVAVGLALVLGCALALSVGATVTAAAPIKLRIGTAIPDYSYAFFTKRPEILKHLGKSYTIEWIKFRGSGSALSAFAAGKTDLSIMTLLPLINAATKYRLDFKIVHSIQDHGVDGHFATVFMARADAGIRKVADLKGKIAGVNVRGGVLDLALRIMLIKNGLKPDRDVTIVEGKFPHLGAMIRDKKIQLGSIIQPFYAREQRKGGLVDVFDTVDAFEGPLPLSYRAAQGALLKKNPAVVRDYVEDYLLAMNWAHDNREEAVRAFSQTWKIPEKALMGYFLTKKDTLYRRDGFVDAQMIQKVIKVLVKYKYVKEEIDASKYIDMSYRPKGL